MVKFYVSMFMASLIPRALSVLSSVLWREEEVNWTPCIDSALA